MHHSIADMEQNLVRRFRAVWEHEQRRRKRFFGLMALYWIALVIVGGVIAWRRANTEWPLALVALAFAAFNAGLLSRQYLKIRKERFPGA